MIKMKRTLLNKIIYNKQIKNKENQINYKNIKESKNLMLRLRSLHKLRRINPFNFP
jgi:hypothetical protein